MPRRDGEALFATERIYFKTLMGGMSGKWGKCEAAMATSDELLAGDGAWQGETGRNRDCISKEMKNMQERDWKELMRVG